MTAPTDDPMPVSVIKAKDKLAPEVVKFYALLCEAEGLTEQATQVELALAEIRDWQERNLLAVKLPDHPHVPVTGGAA